MRLFFRFAAEPLFIKIVFDRLKPEEILSLKERESELGVLVTLDKKGLIHTVAFEFPAEDPVWQAFSPNRFYAIEREIIENVIFEENKHYERDKIPFYFHFEDTDQLMKRANQWKKEDRKALKKKMREEKRQSIN